MSEGEEGEFEGGEGEGVAVPLPPLPPAPVPLVEGELAGLPLEEITERVCVLTQRLLLTPSAAPAPGQTQTQTQTATDDNTGQEQPQQQLAPHQRHLARLFSTHTPAQRARTCRLSLMSLGLDSLASAQLKGTIENYFGVSE